MTNDECINILRARTCRARQHPRSNARRARPRSAPTPRPAARPPLLAPTPRACRSAYRTPAGTGSARSRSGARRAAMGTSALDGARPSRSSVARSVVGEAPVLATRTYVSTPAAHSPSAIAQRGHVCSAPRLTCASRQVADDPGHHMARSATIGASASITIDTAVEASDRPGAGVSSLTSTVNRLRACTTWVTGGVGPPGRRYTTRTGTGEVPGLPSSRYCSNRGPV